MSGRLARRVGRLALGLVLLLGVATAASPAPTGRGARSAAQVVAESGRCEPTETVALDDDRPGFTWIAEPDLSPVARILASRDGIFRPFRGLPRVPERAAALGPAAGPGQDADPSDAAEPPLRIVLVRDLACLEALGITNPRADWVAGLAVLGERTVAVRVERAGASIPEVAAVLRHELAHVALHRASSGRAPRWLHEGYAQLESGSWDWSEAWRLRWTFLRGSGDDLAEIELGVPRDPAGARLAYLLSYTAAQTLWELSGERGFSAFVAALAEGADSDQAFRRVFGITEGQFAERWRRSVASRYGLLYTLSRVAVFWIFVSLLLVWAGLRRRSIKRERLEALRESDRREAALFGREHPVGFRFDGPESGPEPDVDAGSRPF